MPRGSAPAPSRLETPAGLREMAVRARRLAAISFDDLTFSRLTEFAKELEDRAAALEPETQTFSHEDAVAVQQVETNNDGKS